MGTDTIFLFRRGIKLNKYQEKMVDLRARIEIVDKLEVSNINYSSLLYYCDKKNIATDFLIEGTTLSIAHLKNLKGRTSWVDCNKVLENFNKSIPKSEHDEVFKFSAIGDDFNTVVPLVFGYFSPQIPYWILSKFLGKRLFKNVDYALKIVSPKEITMKITVKGENEVHPLFFEIYAYVFKYLSLLINNKESKVQMFKQGKNSAEYNIILPKRLSLFKRFLQLGKVFAGYRSSVSLVMDLNETNDQLESLTNELYISNEIKNNLLSEVEFQNKELNQLHAQKTTLIRMLVHDIATPLMIASSSLKSLRSLEEGKDLTEQKIRRYDQVSKGLENIIALINEARSLEDIASYKKSFNIEKVDIDQSINYAIELAQAKVPGKKVKIIYHSNLETGTSISADYQKFCNSVLANIISNSIKFSYEGNCVEIASLIGLDNMVVITIKDHGIGIPLHLQNDLFNLEKKTSRIGTNGERGTGYGMPIMKSIVDTLGGEIGIESYDINTNPHNHGTTFTLRFTAIESESFIFQKNSNSVNPLNIEA